MSGAASCAEYRRAKGVNSDVVRKEGEGEAEGKERGERERDVRQSRRGRKKED